MKSLVSRLFVLVASLAFCFVPLWAGQAQTLDIAGHVAMAARDTIADGSNDNPREIARRSEIYASESIHTGGSGRAQLRMRDSAFVAFSCNSSLKVAGYVYQESQSDNVILNELEGSFAHDNGTCRQEPFKQFTLNVSNAWVNTRDADFKIRPHKNRAVYCQACSGYYTAPNSSKTLLLRVGEYFDFARVNLHETTIPLRFYPQQFNVLRITTTTALNQVLPANKEPTQQCYRINQYNIQPRD